MNEPTIVNLTAAKQRKVGRPKVTNTNEARTIRISVGFNKREYDEFNEFAQRNGFTLASFLRSAAHQAIRLARKREAGS